MASVEPGPPARPSSATPAEQTNQKEVAVSHLESEKPDAEKGEGALPSALAPIEALCLENWRELEKKLVRRLDMTMMPCLWVC
jgi:hypothetical protein